MGGQRRLRRRVLDDWFPTLANYAGVAVGLYGVFIDRGKNPFLFPFAGLLIGIKYVIRSSDREDGEEPEDPAEPPPKGGG